MIKLPLAEGLWPRAQIESSPALRLISAEQLVKPGEPWPIYGESVESVSSVFDRIYKTLGGLTVVSHREYFYSDSDSNETAQEANMLLGFISNAVDEIRGNLAKSGEADQLVFADLLASWAFSTEIVHIRASSDREGDTAFLTWLASSKELLDRIYDTLDISKPNFGISKGLRRGVKNLPIEELLSLVNPEFELAEIIEAVGFIALLEEDQEAQLWVSG